MAYPEKNMSLKNQEKRGIIPSILPKVIINNWEAQRRTRSIQKAQIGMKCFTHQSIHGTGLFVMVKTRSLLSGHIDQSG
jgi:hypothetical protein